MLIAVSQCSKIATARLLEWGHWMNLMIFTPELDVLLPVGNGVRCIPITNAYLNQHG